MEIAPPATERAIRTLGKIPLPAPLKMAVGWLEGVVLALVLPVGVATAATVLSSSGVVVYNMRSVAKATLEKGSFETVVALGKASRSDAGAEGFKDARSNFPGAMTLDSDQYI